LFLFNAIAPPSLLIPPPKPYSNFLLLVNVDSKKALNPTLKFDIKVSDSVAKPALSATYKDGKAVSWQTSYMTVNEISKDFWRHARRLQEEEEVG
jgi:hypothetical protein